MDGVEVPEPGTVIEGVVNSIFPFGVFLQVRGYEHLPILVRRVDLDPAGCRVFDDDMPSLGDILSGVVLGQSDGGDIIVSRRREHYPRSEGGRDQ